MRYSMCRRLQPVVALTPHPFSSICSIQHVALTLMTEVGLTPPTSFNQSTQLHLSLGLYVHRPTPRQVRLLHLDWSLGRVGPLLI